MSNPASILVGRDGPGSSILPSWLQAPWHAILFYAAWCFCWMLTPVKLEYYGTDTFEYITLAQKWTHLEWADAVNGYWSPLISWMLVSFLWVFEDPLLAFKVLQILLGGIAVYSIHQLAVACRLSGWLLFTFDLLAALMVSSYALLYGTPDLLLLLLLVMYLFSLVALRDQYVLHGIAGGLMFLAKAYALPFFIAHITLYYLFGFGNGRKKSFRNWWRTMAVFIVIAGCWVAVLSVKYGKFTISHSGKYNLALVSPDRLDPEWKMHPAFFGGLFPPPNATAISAWEDPSRQPITPWNPLASVDDLKHYAKVIWLNVLSFYYSHIQRQTGVVLLFLLLRLGFAAIRNRLKFPSGAMFLLFTATLYTAGYLLVFPTTRYLWPVSLIVLLLIFILGAQKAGRRRLYFAVGMACIVIGSFFAAKRALKELVLLEDKDVPAAFAFHLARHPAAVIDSVYAPFIYYDSLNATGALRFLKGRNVAGIRDDQSYQYASFLGLHNGFRYYGELTDSLLQAGYAQQLSAYAIEYLFITDTVTDVGRFEDYAPELLLHDPNTRLRIYALNP